MNTIREWIERFFAWYKRYEKFHTLFNSVLFSWQLVHLYWLTTAVALPQLTGRSFFNPSTFWEYLIIVVDYTEIPALLSASIFYIYKIRNKEPGRFKNISFLFFLNSQWIHIFWITDTFIIKHFESVSGIGRFPHWIAWVAIGIDYLELPVIFDMVQKSIPPVIKKLKEI